MFESTSSLCSRPSLSLQDAHLGAMGQAVNTSVSVSMVGPATQPREPATALLGFLGQTVALVRIQTEGLGSILLNFWGRRQGPAGQPMGGQCPAQLLP